ncbi:homoserine kinase [uncultured Ilyobacter sp.]|uniref:homoserine kinase n=1 Tax=uncultured Ilyobacter sp. TaxID=544433 RepID=UPI0029C0F1BE|nr:homoserine kinase [uncultured Ilyobacter sp.]
MAVYTKLSDDYIKNILKNYSFKKVDRIEEISEGILNTNYFIEGDKGKFIFRILEGERDYTEEAKELEFLEYLNSNGFPCPTAIKNVSGENYEFIDGKMASVFTFIEGEKVKSINENNMKEIGRKLGKMHTLLKDRDITRNRKIDMQYFYDIISKSDLKGILKDDYDFIIKYYERASKVDYSNLPFGIIHNDIFPDNVFMQGGEISGIIDFNDCLRGPLILDLAIVISFWIRNRGFSDEVENRLTKVFLNAYETERKITKEEMELMDEALIRIALTFIFLRVNKFHVEDNSSVNMEFKNYKDLLPLLRYF